jgi:succinoglycan biosynthesis transport protein ExoP
MRPLAPREERTTAPRKASDTQDSDSGLSIRDIFRMIARHWAFIVGCLVLCVTLSYLYARSITPIYEASGSMRLDPNRAGSLGLADLTGAGSGGTGVDINTEMAVIQSDSVAIGTLQLLTDDEFLHFAGKPRGQLGFLADTAKLTPAQEGLLASLKGALKAHEIGNTQLIAITFRGPDQQIAATIVNDTMSAYLKESFDNRYGSVTQVRKWLSGEMNSLQNQAVEAQKKLAGFQEKNNFLTTGNNSNTTLDTLKLLSDDLTKAKADRLVREAQMQAAMSGDPHVVAATFSTPTFAALQLQQSALYQQYVQLSSKFGESYPPLIEVKRQMVKLDTQFETELATVRARVKQDYDTSAATERLLQSQYNTQLAKAYGFNRQEAEYASLVSDSKSTRELYDTLEHKLQQAGVDAGLNAVNTMLVDRARAPLAPIEPNKSAILGFGLMLGLLTGVGTAFLKEAITDTVQSVDQLEHTLRYNTLAAVPHISADGSQHKLDASGVPFRPTLVCYNQPLSRSSESFRNLRNGLLLSNDKVKTILLTSTIAGEGKSTATANFAVILAQYGAKVLVIDADLRRPRLHELFGLENLFGLSNLILNEQRSGALHQPLPELQNLSVLTAGKRIGFPSELLSANRFRQLLEEWENQFDYILLDSAPLLLVSDSLPLASWADAAILVLRYNQTPISALRRVRSILGQTQAFVAGVVLNDMPDKAMGYGGYADGAGYYE